MKLFLLLSCLAAASPAYSANEPLRLVSVGGNGEVKIKPDKASVSLQVTTKAKDAKSAQAKNAREMARVEKVLKEEFGIPASDIQTSGFSVYPEYRYEQNGKQVFTGYSVSHSLSVEVKKLEKLGNLLDRVVGKGTEEAGVQLQHVGFASSRQQETEIAALEGAMANAKARAEALARFAKRSLKGVVRISDSSVDSQAPPYPRPMAKMAMAEADSGTQVSPGEITVSARVSVDYEME